MSSWRTVTVGKTTGKVQEVRPVRGAEHEFHHWVDVPVMPGALAQFVVAGDEVTFHGLQVGAEVNIGAEDPIDGTLVPDGAARELILKMVDRVGSAGQSP